MNLSHAPDAEAQRESLRNEVFDFRILTFPIACSLFPLLGKLLASSLTRGYSIRGTIESLLINDDAC